MDNLFKVLLTRYKKPTVPRIHKAFTKPELPNSGLSDMMSRLKDYPKKDPLKGKK